MTLYFSIFSCKNARLLSHKHPPIFQKRNFTWTLVLSKQALQNLQKQGLSLQAPRSLWAAGGGSDPAPAQPPTTVPAELQAAIKLAAAQDALFATSVPSTGAAINIHFDDCYLNSGYTKAVNVSNFDANVSRSKASNAYRIGSKRSNVRVLSVGASVNSDGSTRTQAEILFDINYADGSVNKDAWSRLITGSSKDSCATPTSSTEWRIFGNQRLFGVSVQGRNIRDERYSLATGAALTTPLTYRRDLQFNLNDPQGLATYAILSGPGNTTVNGVFTPLVFKLLAPKVLRDDPSMVGKRGHYTNLETANSFGVCTNPLHASNTAAAYFPLSAVDCRAGASGGLSWGITLNVPSTGVSAATLELNDRHFNGFNFVAGGVYKFDIYNDDGWKTPNGHVGKKPIATRTTTLAKLPYTFAEMSPDGGAGSTDKFARGTAWSMTPVQAAAAIKSSTPSDVSVTWVAPGMQADGRVFRLNNLGEYFNGATATNTGGAFWPAERYFTPTYLGSTATTGSVGITGAPSTIASKNFAEFSMVYTDRNNGRLISAYTFR